MARSRSHNDVLERAPIEGKCSLADGRQANVGRKHEMRCLFEHPGARQTGRRQNDRVTLALAKLADACFDVPPERDETEVRALALELDHATARRRPDFGAGAKRSQVRSIERDQNIARVLPRGDT